MQLAYTRHGPEAPRNVSRRDRILARSALYWARQAQGATEDYARDRAWRNALACAEATPLWWVERGAGTRGRPDHLWRITRVGQRGAVYGRRHYRTRAPGAERQVWGALR